MSLPVTKMKAVQISFQQELTNMLTDLRITIPEVNFTEAENVYNNLTSVLPNSITVKHVLKSKENVNKKIENVRKFENFLNAVKTEWSKGYIIVTLGQIISLCKKYNLVLAPADTFIGDIPEKHATIINNYVKEVKRTDHYAFRYDSNFFAEYSRGDHNTAHKLAVASDISNLNLTGYGVINNIAVPNPPVIVSPPPVLEKDPIILHRIPDICGIRVCRVVTAWDTEGSDILLQARNKNAN